MKKQYIKFQNGNIEQLKQAIKKAKELGFKYLHENAFFEGYGDGILIMEGTDCWVTAEKEKNLINKNFKEWIV